MVIRVASLLFCLLLTALALVVHPGTAGNAAVAYSMPCPPPPSCAPPPCPPPSCGPPSCGSGLTGPGSLCGACLNICTTCCGTLIGIPAAVMQGILAPPPPPRYRPPSGCGPAMCPPPMCGPPPCSPQPITKCRPAAYGTGPMPYGYAPAAASPAPVAYGTGPMPYGYAPAAAGPAPAPFMIPASSPPIASFYMGPPVEQSGLSNVVSQIVQIPFRLVSGTLTAPGSPWGQDLFAAPPTGSSEATFGSYW